MRRFSFKVDLRKGQPAPGAPKSATPAPVARDGFAMSDTLRPQRQGLRDWPRFQQRLAGLPAVTRAADHFEDAELAKEYVRIYGDS